MVGVGELRRGGGEERCHIAGAGSWGHDITCVPRLSSMFG